MFNTLELVGTLKINSTICILLQDKIIIGQLVLPQLCQVDTETHDDNVDMQSIHLNN